MYKTLDLKENIELIITDFDGIFTDGGLFVGEDCKTFKKVSFKDLMGVSIATKKGIRIAIVSGEKTAAIDVISKRFKIEDVYQDIRNKKAVVEELLHKYRLIPEKVLYVGDDINDIEAMMLVANRICPPNANFKMKQTPNIQITQNVGGDGVFREIVDNLVG